MNATAPSCQLSPVMKKSSAAKNGAGPGEAGEQVPSCARSGRRRRPRSGSSTAEMIVEAVISEAGSRRQDRHRCRPPNDLLVDRGFSAIAIK